MWYALTPTPIGELLLIAGPEGLLRVEFERKGRKPPAEATRDDARLSDVVAQLDDYFAGRRKTFDLRLAPQGTPFQLEVWKALQGITYGQTCSYSDIARTIGRPAAVRAVGAANGANPIPIIIPCHRVIGASGSLTGFGGGLGVKRRLLDLEAGVRGLI